MDYTPVSLRTLAYTLLVAAFGFSAASVQDSYRSSYFKDGEIHVNVLGQPEGKPITEGHWDFKPSWSITGDHLVFFRRLKNDPDVSNWITQLCINIDGTGFHPLSDGTYTDFNPTWTWHHQQLLTIDCSLVLLKNLLYQE
jgi:hypothetical protein